MKKKRRTGCILVSLLLVICLLAAPLGYFLLTKHVLPTSTRRTIADGVIYRRVVRYLPEPLVMHIVLIDVKQAGVRFLVTPPDFTDKGEHPLKARTTSEFMNDFRVDIAINGGGFTPWYANGPDYYPHSGDPVTPIGKSMSKGNLYADGPGPTLYITANNSLSFNFPTGKPQNILAGDRMLVRKGQVVEGLDDVERAPRTAVGVSRNGNTLILAVIDGRQPLYSRGMTFAELATLILNYGADMAMALDGGGSSTLVVRDKDGQPQVLNSPIHAGVPGLERPVANHLGVFLGR
jgi:hypothetical protein